MSDCLSNIHYTFISTRLSKAKVKLKIQNFSPKEENTQYINIE